MSQRVSWVDSLSWVASLWPARSVPCATCSQVPSSSWERPELTVDALSDGRGARASS
jgi:hypothetical protein